MLTLSNRLVLNLCICNFLLTVLVLPPNAAAAALGQWPLSRRWCSISAFSTSGLFTTCVFTLLAISFDRYYAIIRPLHYRMRVTRRRLTGLLVALWLTSGLIAAQPLFRPLPAVYRSEWGLCTYDWASRRTLDRAYAYAYLSTCFVAPLVFMCACYVSIFRAAQHTSARARRNSADVGLVHGVAAMTGGVLAGVFSARRQSNASLLHYANGQHQHQHQPIARRSSASGLARGLLMLHKDDQKAAATGMIVMSTFIVCWLPVFALIAYEAWPGRQRHSGVSRYLGNAAAWTAFAGCALNPFVYVFRSRAIVKECRLLLGCRIRNGSAAKRRTASWPPSRNGTSEAERISPPVGLACNGLPCNGLPCNGLPCNGMSGTVPTASSVLLPTGKLSPLREQDITVLSASGIAMFE